MRKILLALCILTLLSITLVSGAVDSINYPYSGQNLTAPKLQLNISTTGSTNCYWNYNNIHNETINCNDVSLINLPAIDGVYNITASDNTGSRQSVIVHLTQIEPEIKLFFFVGFILLIVVLFWSVFNVIGHFVKLDCDLKDIIFAFSSYFVFLAYYGLLLEYFDNFLILQFSEMILDVGSYTHIFLPAIAFVVSFSIGQWYRTKGKGGEELG